MNDSINIKKELNDMNEAPSLMSNKISYNCSECPSIIEIISIDENNFEFKCNNNHNIKMKIKDYLNKMKLFNKNNNINNNICNIHKEEYLSYCFDCNTHLCKECLKLGEHSYHYKINIIEIIPNNEILIKIGKLIKNNRIKIEDLNNTKKETENKIKYILSENINKIKRIKLINKENNNKYEKEELKLNKNKYNLGLKNLKKEYENKMKKLKMNYYNNINNIKNKYKILNNKNENIYNNKIIELNKKADIKIRNYKFNERINKVSNFNELIEIIYNTYINYNSNYYNTINISNIYNTLFNNNKINKLKEKYNIFESYKYKLKEKENEKENIIKEKENMIKNYESKIKEKENIIEKNKNVINKYKIDISNKKNTMKIIYKIDNQYNNEIRIFGDLFVSNNKDNCKIFYNNQIYELVSKFKVQDINQLEIELNGILNITNMEQIFYGCSNLISLPDIHLIGTNNVTNMSFMFFNCTSLTSLPDISIWNTDNVTNMSRMFCKCSSLISLPDISKWNTNKVTNMAKMFYNCSSLTSMPDISKWNINNVKNMSDMFEGCCKLDKIPVLIKNN